MNKTIEADKGNIIEHDVNNFDSAQKPKKVAWDSSDIVSEAIDQKMAQNNEKINDGADEKMLFDSEQEQLAKKEEVKFINKDLTNGDAKIDIGAIDKTFTGMTKEELMKYANDPFWIRLRWIFFCVFWLMWAAMLVGAVLIIVNAPKCAAPMPLAWWKQGPLVKYDSIEQYEHDIIEAKKVNAKGVIYEVPADLTYSIGGSEIESKIKSLTKEYSIHGINVVLDITPNYVTAENLLLKNAIKYSDKRTPFIWIKKENEAVNWQIGSNGLVFKEILPNNYILSQFGDGKYDIQMNNDEVKIFLKDTLNHLMSLGVKGFRLFNSKHFIIDPKFKETIESKYVDSQKFENLWILNQTTYQNGIGDLLNEFRLFVRNQTNGEGFLSVGEDMIHPEIYKTEYDEFGIDLPFYGSNFSILRNSIDSDNAYHQLREIFETVDSAAWMQWNYNLDENSKIDISAYNMFFMLMPGVVVLSNNFYLNETINENFFEQLNNMRMSPSFMYGTFTLHNKSELIAFSRIKSGNPGFLIVLNPTNKEIIGNFSSLNLPEKVTYDLLSDNYNITNVSVKGKAFSDQIPMSPYSAAILTYVPVKN